MAGYICRNTACPEYPRVFEIDAAAEDAAVRLGASYCCDVCRSRHVQSLEEMRALIKPVVRFIGDVHGLYADYNELTLGAAVTIQVGDLGLHYAALRSMRDRVRKNGHDYAIAGNHDNYDPDSPEYFRNQPDMLGDHGVLHLDDDDDVVGFYMRGGFSIDQDQRNKDPEKGLVEWWADEELSEEACDKAVDTYVAAKPLFVVSHECPLSIVPFVTDPRVTEQYGYEAQVISTRTNRTLQRMLDAHKPRHWIFGHYHKRWTGSLDGTRFTCLDMVRHGDGRRGERAGSVLDLPRWALMEDAA